MRRNCLDFLVKSRFTEEGTDTKRGGDKPKVTWRMRGRSCLPTRSSSQSPPCQVFCPIAVPSTHTPARGRRALTSHEEAQECLCPHPIDHESWWPPTRYSHSASDLFVNPSSAEHLLLHPNYRHCNEIIYRVILLLHVSLPSDDKGHEGRACVHSITVTTVAWQRVLAREFLLHK